MYKRPLVLMIAIVTAACPLLAVDHWWHGGVSNNVNDPANWTDRNAATEPTTPGADPSGSPYDIVRIGASWGSEDLNGNGVLDPGEDLNGNGIIDDPVSPNVVGYGGYYGTYGDPPVVGGGVDVAVDPVLSDTYVSRYGTPYGGWWFVLNAPNILTLKDGAFLIMNRENCNLRNGGRLEVQGRSKTGGPSLIVARRFRIAENGSIAEAAQYTSQLRIKGTGWVQMDPALKSTGEAFMIGTSDPPGTRPRGEIVIEDEGRLEILPANPAPYLDFGNTDPSVNQIIIRDSGELWMPGDQATMGRVGPDNRVVSLQEMISMGLITNDQGGKLIVMGSNPTVIKVAGATNPSPAKADQDVNRKVVLSWDPAPGLSTVGYDVYFGSSLDSVKTASRTNPLGVLKSQGQMETKYPKTGVLALDFGQTYYWRVDSITAGADSTILPGRVWHFTVEPFARTLGSASIRASASSSLSDNSGPDKTVDGSGLSPLDQHDTNADNMWTSAVGQEPPVWIQYEFDTIYKLHQMLVWNSNSELEWFLGLGVKTARVEYSADGLNWTELAGVPEFAQAPGRDSYSPNIIVNFGGAAARFVRIVCTSSWGGGSQYGLSEVRFLYIPLQARDPKPANGSVGVAIDTTFSWKAGREAELHHVYLGTNPDGLNLIGTTSATSYTPTDLLLGTQYYWRVDEVNQAEAISMWPGSIWSFTTADHIVVDDFEAYSNSSPTRVFQTWIDGLGFSADEYFPNGHNGNGTGAIVGYDPSAGNIMETTTVHGGRQAMPLTYNGPSEATRSFAPAQDWTRSGVKTLVLYFYGPADNVPGELYVKINGTKVSYKGDPADLAAGKWRQWSIDLPAEAGLREVKTLTIGISGGKGKLYIDDICLYQTAPTVEP